ncbi:MAG: hypothetical protein SNJ64_07070, partial [Endomicrobiia bacterium]
LKDGQIIKNYINQFIEFIGKTIYEGMEFTDSKIGRVDNNKPMKKYSGCNYCDYEEMCALDFI